MRTSRMRRLVGDLSGRSHQRLRALLLAQIAATVEGATLARAVVAGEQRPDEARQLMTSIEHDGDDARERLVTEMSRSLVTPIDPEDLFRVSRSIDDVLDSLRDFVREFDLFDVAADQILPVFEPIAESLTLLRDAVATMGTGTPDVRQRVLRAKKSCNAIQRVYETQLVAVLVGSVDVGMLRRRELLRRLDIVGLRLGEAVDAMADAAVKRTL